LKDPAYALDTTTIDLCLSVFPWLPVRSIKAAVKLHSLLDLGGNILTFICINDGKLNLLDQLVPEPGTFYVMDRGPRPRAPAPLSRAGSTFRIKALFDTSENTVKSKIWIAMEVSSLGVEIG
jgi:hypothetical protein